jgi:hypothetical protein
MVGARRQTPVGGEVYLDHVGWFVGDMDRAGVAFERLGFVLTPFVAQKNADPDGGPPVPAGTGNRCAMLRRGYLEVLATVAGLDTPLVRQHDAAIARYTGVHLLAFTVADAQAAQARLAQAGFAPQDPVHLRRPIETEGGGEAEVAFTVIRVPPGTMAEGRVQILTQETPDLVWQDRLLARDNRIAALTGALLCVADVDEAAARYARFLGRPAAGGGDYAAIALDRGRLAFAGPARCRALLPGIDMVAPPVIAAVALETDDIAATRLFLRSRGIPLAFEGADRLCVDPGAAMGAALLIHGPDDVWPPDAA